MADLEPLVPESWEELVPPSERRRLPAWLHRVPWLALVLVLTIAGGLATGWVVLARHAVRDLERDQLLAAAWDAGRTAKATQLSAAVELPDDDAIAGAGLAAIIQEEAGVLDRLARHAGRVLAVDPGVRRLRAATVADIRHRQRQLDSVREAAMATGGARAAALLRSQLRQWRLQPRTFVPNAPMPRAADAALARLRQGADVPTGLRLLLLRGPQVEVLDVDRNTRDTTTVPGNVAMVVPVGTWAAVVTDAGVRAVDLPPGRGGQGQVPPALDGLATAAVPSSAPGLVWLSNADGAVEVERNGATHRRVPGRLVVGDTGSWLVAAHTNGLPGDIQDAATGRVVRHLPEGAHVAATGPGRLAVIDGPTLTVLSSTTSAEEHVVLDPHEETTLAAFSPGGGSLAVAAGREGQPAHLRVMREGGAVQTVALPGELAASAIRWSDADHVLVPIIADNAAFTIAWVDLRDGSTHLLRVHGEFQLVAAF